MNDTTTAETARSLVLMGLEVNAEIADDEPRMSSPGLDRALFELVCQHGLVGVLEALTDAAWSSAEMNEEVEEETVACLRARIVGKRLERVLAVLK